MRRIETIGGELDGSAYTACPRGYEGPVRVVFHCGGSEDDEAVFPNIAEATAAAAYAVGYALGGYDRVELSPADGRQITHEAFVDWM